MASILPNVFLMGVTFQSAIAAVSAAAPASSNWPQFRGPHASGVSDGSAPVSWNVESGENIRWQSSIPGLGHGCPIIWNDRVYLASTVKPGGKAELKVGIYGAGDSYKEKEPHHDGKVVVQCDVLSGQYLAAFDAQDGRQLWRTPRQEVATWCTPIIGASPGRLQVIVNGWKHLGGYDLDTGRELWRLEGGGDVPVASPIIWGDLVFLTSGHGKYRPMRAVRLNAVGNITPAEMGATNSAVVWCHPRQGNYLQTPLVLGDLLWGCSNDGIVTCFDAKTGRMQYSERIGGGGQGFTASPVAAKGRIYFTGELGEVFVLPARDKFSVLATNKLGDLCLSTPAISEGVLFFRTRDKLLAVGPKQ